VVGVIEDEKEGGANEGAEFSGVLEDERPIQKMICETEKITGHAASHI
jgi:hypothetical protein